MSVLNEIIDLFEIPDEQAVKELMEVTGAELNALKATIQQNKEIADIVTALGGISYNYTDSDKQGFWFKNTLVGETVVKREYVQNPNYTAPTGDYLNPIPYHVGDSVSSDLWYTDDSGNIWQAIKDGTPAGFDDVEYFDIVEV